MRLKDTVEIIASIAVVGGGIYALGLFNGRLNAMEQRLSQLETRVDPLRAVRVGKGDLCMKMLEQWGTARTPQRQQELSEQWSRSGCEGLPANATMNEAEAQALGYDAAGNRN